jgi:hypothetical protein
VAELIVDDKNLVVHLTLGEKVWGFHGDIRVRLSSIVSVAPDPMPWLGLRGWRMAGVSFLGHAALGTRRHGDGYDFCILHRDRAAVRVDVASGRFSRVRDDNRPENRELWTRPQPTGIRASDAVAWARHIRELYGGLDFTSNNAQGLH